MTTLWIVISTFCINPIQGVPREMLWTSTSDAVMWTDIWEVSDCIRYVQMVGKEPKNEKFVYRVIPATATACDLRGHSWDYINAYPRGDCFEGGKCRRCGKCREKKAVMKEDWEWEE